MRYFNSPALCSFAICFALLFVGIANGQITETKLTASDGAAADNLGISISISGDYLLVGAYEDDDNGSDAGAAYIFHYDGVDWVEQAKLIASDGAAGDNFGVSVSLSGDYALIGADWDDDNGTFSGSAYVFHRNGSSWVQQAKLLASDGDLFDNFGQSVSISDEFAIIGSLYDDDNGFASGSAYVFRNDGTTWVQQTKLLASDGAGTDYFGWSVSISGDYTLIGANGDNTNGMDAGSAYVFHYDGSGWTEEDKLLASDRATSDNFGRAVAISGDLALIGAPYNNDRGTFSGSAYIFRRDGSTWVEQTKLLASDGTANDDFGLSVALLGDYAIVGAPYDDTNGTAGSVYLFHYDGSDWLEQTRLWASDASGFAYFGYSTALSDDFMAVGSPQDDAKGSNSGSAYVYTGFASTLSCEEINRFQARCRPGGLVQARVTLANTSHTGESVEFSIDGIPHEVTIDQNGRAIFSHGGYITGSHSVELTNPPGCEDPLTVVCPSGQLKESEDPWDDEVWEVPLSSGLLDNYPDPFNPTTTIRYSLSQDVHVTLRVYDLVGRLVATLVDEEQLAGYQQATWNASNEAGQRVASGMYMYRITAGAFSETKRMVLLK